MINENNNTMIKQILEFFGKNALRGKESGCTVQEIANINKETAIIVFGLSNSQAEDLVTIWVKECQLSGIFVK